MSPGQASKAYSEATLICMEVTLKTPRNIGSRPASMSTLPTRSYKDLRFLCSRGRWPRQRRNTSPRQKGRRQRRRLQPDIAAAVALFSCAQARAILNFYASLRRKHSQLQLDRGLQQSRDDVLQACPRLLQRSDGE